MILQVKTKKQVEETLTIEVPCFFKRGTSFLAVFDESDVIQLDHGYGSFCFISGGTFDMYKAAIAAGGWTDSDEQEFRYEYEKAIKQIAIPRKEITAGELYEETELLKTFH